MSAKTSNYHVGQTVYHVAHGGKVCKKTQITEVKTLKRHVRITCADGTKWDAGSERQWGHLSDEWYTGARLREEDEGIKKEWSKTQTVARLQWAAKSWDDLSDEEQAELDALLVKIRQAHPLKKA